MDVYVEITGYAVSCFVFLHWRHGTPGQLEAAREAADYLMRIQAAGGDYAPFTFDTAMCIVGMVRLAAVTGEARFLESAVAAGQWLQACQRPDGSFTAMTPGAGGSAPGGFFGDGSCIHSKCAMALLELHASTGGEPWRDAAIRACDYTMTLQTQDGAFQAVPGDPEVFTHAHCYACEGLLFAGKRLSVERFVAGARRGVEWLETAQSADGSWHSRYKLDGSRHPRRWVLDRLLRPRPSDAAAQAARLMMLSGRARTAGAALDFLTSCQRQDGGFAYQATRRGYSGFENTWSAQFAIQALTWDREQGDVDDLF